MNTFTEKILIPVMILLGLLAPVLVSAQEENVQISPLTNTPTTLPQCVAFSTLQDQLKIRFSMMEDTLTQRISNVEERLQKRNTTDKTDLLQTRKATKIERDTQFDEMRKNAATENDKVAVEAYIGFVEQAYTEYQETIDNNLHISNQTDELMLQYYNILSGAILNYRISIISALDYGKTACAEKKGIPEIYNTIKVLNEEARTTYNEVIEKDANKLKDGLVALITTLKKNEETARTILENSINEAYQKLQETLSFE